MNNGRASEQAWAVKAMAVLDWYDGAIEGLIKLEVNVPREYWFKSVFRDYDRDFIVFVLLGVEWGTLLAGVEAVGTEVYQSGSSWNLFPGNASPATRERVETVASRGRAEGGTDAWSPD